MDLSYAAHFARAAGFGVRLIAAGCAALTHAAPPGLFTHTASRAIEALHTELRAPAPRRTPSASAVRTAA